eukprot:7235259-Alexandrium_andersonii.AAC.1
MPRSASRSPFPRNGGLLSTPTASLWGHLQEVEQREASAAEASRAAVRDGDGRPPHRLRGKQLWP